MIKIRQNASGVVTGLTTDGDNGQQVFTRQPDGSSFIRAQQRRLRLTPPIPLFRSGEALPLQSLFPPTNLEHTSTSAIMYFHSNILPSTAERAAPETASKVKRRNHPHAVIFGVNAP